MALDPNRIYNIKGAVLGAMLLAAAAGGYAAGEAELSEVQAKDIDHLERVTAQMSGPSKTKLAAIINEDLCPQVEAQAGLAAGVCTAQKVMARAVGNVDIRGRDTSDPPDGTLDEYDIGAQLRLPGSVTVSMP